MFIKNNLTPPEAFETTDFEALLQAQKDRLVELIQEDDPDQATAVAQTLSEETELLTKFLRHLVIEMQARLRQANEQYRQTLPDFAVDSNLDAVVSRQGLERRDEESDEQLLERYYLSLAAPARGTKLGYIASARTLDDEPQIEFSEEDDGFSLRYRLSETSIAALIKNVNATSPNAGEVDIVFQAFDSENNATIQQALESHFAQEKLLTDKLIVQPALVLDYSVTITLGIYDDPDSETIRASAEQSISGYLETQERIGATIEPTELIHLSRLAGAARVTIEPSEPIIASDYQVPINNALTIQTELL